MATGENTFNKKVLLANWVEDRQPGDSPISKDPHHEAKFDSQHWQTTSQEAYVQHDVERRRPARGPDVGDSHVLTGHGPKQETWATVEMATVSHLTVGDTGFRPQEVVDVRFVPPEPEKHPEGATTMGTRKGMTASLAGAEDDMYATTHKSEIRPVDPRDAAAVSAAGRPTGVTPPQKRKDGEKVSATLDDPMTALHLRK